MKNKNGALILNYNDSIRTMKLADTLVESGLFEIIVVVDNNSNDEYSKELRVWDNREKVKVIYSSINLFYAGGTNLGIEFLLKNYSLDYVLIVNSDVLLSKGTINYCIEYMDKNDKVGLCTPTMLNYKEEIDYRVCWNTKSYFELIASCFFLGRRFVNYSKKCRQDDEVIYCDCIRASFQLFRYNLLNDIGGYDTKAKMYYEEDIISKKIKTLNYTTVVLKQVSYVHNHNDNKAYYSNIFKICLNDMYYYFKNYRKNNFINLGIMKLCMVLGIFEHMFIDIYLRIKHKKIYK